MCSLREKDLKYIWHPFTQMQGFDAEENLIMVRGEGNYLYDEDGGRYFDATSSLWVCAHGHNHPAINAGIRRQLCRISHSTLLGSGNEPAALLAKELVEITPPGLDRVFFSDNGSTAAEVALKMAFQYHRQQGAAGEKRSRFVSLDNGYHGDTIGSVSVGGMELFHSIFSPLLFHTYRAPSPSCYRCSFGLARPGCGLECVNAMDRLLADKGDEIAAVVVEPLVQGAGGMVAYPPEVLRGYHEAARRHGVLFIADEVATGFGRTGEMFACETAGIVPDLMAVAKALTGGYLPVAATLATDEIYQGFMGEHRESRTFFHGHTYTGNQLGCASALASLGLMQEPGFLPGVRSAAEALRKALTTLVEHPHVGDIRQVGLMAGIELVQDRDGAIPFPVEKRTGHQVCLAARECGVLARPLGDVLVLMPPLSSTSEELSHLVDSLAFGLGRVVGGGRAAPVPMSRRSDPALGLLSECTHYERAQKPHRLLITGTDTGVGKTIVSAGLAAALGEVGAVACYKPVESGVRAPNSGDRGFLAKFAPAPAGAPEFSYVPPLSPSVAARITGQSCDFDAIVNAIAAVRADQVLLVEGAGGLMVSMTDSHCFADLARAAGLAVLVVVGNRLGCLNHAVLTVRAAHDLGVPLAGVVLNNLSPEQAGGADISVNHNEAELRRLLGDLVLGTVPYVPDVNDPQAVVAACRDIASKLR